MSSQSNKVLVINLTTVQQHVDIVDEEGNKTSVNIMPKKRVYLEEGFSVCKNWAGRNPKAVKSHEPEPEVDNTPVTRAIAAIETDESETK